MASALLVGRGAPNFGGLCMWVAGRILTNFGGAHQILGGRRRRLWRLFLAAAAGPAPDSGRNVELQGGQRGGCRVGGARGT
jgi:hypothetical protein